MRKPIDPTRSFLRDPRGYIPNAHSPQVREMLGLRPEQKLPPEGMPPRIIQGIKVWVAPLPQRTPEEIKRLGKFSKRSTHRVLAECPRCGKVLSVGRLHQHVC